MKITNVGKSYNIRPDKSSYYSSNSNFPTGVIEGEEIFVPTFELSSNPTVKLSDIKAKKFYIVDKEIIKSKEDIQKEEDNNIFKAIVNAQGKNYDIEQAAHDLKVMHGIDASEELKKANEAGLVGFKGSEYYDSGYFYNGVYVPTIHVSSVEQFGKPNLASKYANKMIEKTPTDLYSDPVYTTSSFSEGMQTIPNIIYIPNEMSPAPQSEFEGAIVMERLGTIGVEKDYTFLDLE